MANKSFDRAQDKRVLIFSLSYFPLVGGAEVAVKEITDRLGEEIEFDLVTLRFSKKHSRFEKVGNVNVYRIGGGFGYLSKIFFVPRAALFTLHHKYDFYWAMMTYMLFPAALARILGGRTNRTDYVLTLQDGDPFSRVFNRWFILPFKPLLSYGFKHAAKVQAISNFLAQWARQMGYQGGTLVIPNGVDLEKFQNPKPRTQNPNEIILVTTSRLVPKNGVGDVIEAMKFLPEHFKLKIIGSGRLESKLKLQATNYKLQTRIEFLGEIPHSEIPKYLHQADIFVRPSLSEGQGISFIEAMAAGLPVIATPVGGIPDFLEDGVTGLFVEPKNPRLIAFQVQKLVSDRVLRDKITINARRMVMERYNWNLIARDMKNKVFKI